MIPGRLRGNLLLWLMGIVQPWTYPWQRLVNDSFVGVRSAGVMVMCHTGRDAGKSMSGSG